MGAKVLKRRLLLSLGIFWRSRYRLSTQVEMLYVLAVPALQRILVGISQLANGRVKPLAKPDIEFNCSKSVCVGIHELPPGGPSFRPHPLSGHAGSVLSGNQQTQHLNCVRVTADYDVNCAEQPGLLLIRGFEGDQLPRPSLVIEYISTTYSAATACLQGAVAKGANPCPN
jgi:hypothetical protein